MINRFSAHDELGICRTVLVQCFYGHSLFLFSLSFGITITYWFWPNTFARWQVQCLSMLVLRWFYTGVTLVLRWCYAEQSTHAALRQKDC